MTAMTEASNEHPMSDDTKQPRKGKGKRRPHIRWADTPTLVRELVACPACESTRRRCIRSADQGDSSRLSKHQCLSCGTAYRIVWEPPTPL